MESDYEAGLFLRLKNIYREDFRKNKKNSTGNPGIRQKELIPGFFN